MANELALQEQRIGQFRSVLVSSLKNISSVLPPNMRAERVARISLIELQKQPKLLNCNPQSFLLAVLGSCARASSSHGIVDKSSSRQTLAWCRA
jgi:hypothetical protein